jgi:hypothetical protein
MRSPPDQWSTYRKFPEHVVMPLLGILMVTWGALVVGGHRAGWVVYVFFTLHLLGISITHFEEATPSPRLQLVRTLEGCVFLLPLLWAAVYWCTLLVNGIFYGLANGLATAEITLLYAVCISAWLGLVLLPVAGFWFALSLVRTWSAAVLLVLNQHFQAPFTLYLTIFFMTLFGFLVAGVQLTHFATVAKRARGTWRAVAWGGIVLGAIIGAFLIGVEPTIIAGLANLLLANP